MEKRSRGVEREKEAKSVVKCEKKVGQHKIRDDITMEGRRRHLEAARGEGVKKNEKERER